MHPRAYVCIINEKKKGRFPVKQITWSEMGKQNIQNKKLYCAPQNGGGGEGGCEHSRRFPLPTGLSRPLTWRTDTIIFSKLNREEILLRHVALVAKFLDDDENVTSTCFKLHRSYSVSFNLSNVGEIFWGRIRKDHI